MTPHAQHIFDQVVDLLPEDMSEDQMLRLVAWCTANLSEYADAYTEDGQWIDGTDYERMVKDGLAAIGARHA